jgi:hypothetical protein
MNFLLWMEAQQDWKGMVRQKELPFMRQPDNPLYKNAKSVEPELKHYRDVQYEPGQLYHVTTSLSNIKRDQALKSRRQLGGMAKTSGLGGGAINQAPGLVSLTYNYERAKEIYDGIMYVVSICQGKIKASQVYDRLYDAAGGYDYDEDDELTSVQEFLTDYVPEQLVRDGEADKIRAILDKKIRTAKDVYDFFQGMESAVVEDQDKNHGDWSDEVLTYNVIGFTGDFINMKRIQPKDVAIIQCLVRKNAAVEHEPREVELRVKPEDLVILRYMQPNV